MDMRGYQNYREQSLNTMTPGELLLMLFDELIKRLTRAELALDKGEMPLFEQSVLRASDIVRYLDDTLDMKYPISKELHQLYGFFMHALGRVRVERNRTLLGEVKPMLADLRDTFRQADRMANEEAHA